MATAGDSSELSHVRVWNYRNDASYGSGFITNIVRQFPELAPVRDRMEEAVCQDLEYAFAKYEAYTAALRLACNCGICQGELVLGDKYCCVLIVEVIANMAQSMSIVSLPIGVFPSRLGLEALYGQQFVLRQEIRGDDALKEKLQELGPAYFVIRSDVSPIINAMRIFCGRLPVDLDEYDRTCALSNHGICVYHGVLGHLSDDNESVSQVIVVPGRISLHGKDYRYMKDLTNNYPKETDIWSFALTCTELSVLVKETTSALQIAFEIYGQDTRANSRMLVYPATAIRSLVYARDFVSCAGIACRSVTDDVTIKDEREGYKLYQVAGVDVEVFEANMLQRWILIDRKLFDNAVIYVDRERTDRCLRAAVKKVQSREGSRAVVIYARH